MPNFLAVGHPIMHLSSANSNVTLTLGRGVSWNVMNNLIKLHSRSKRGIIRLVLWVLAALKVPSQVKASSQTPCLELNEAVRKCYRLFRGAHWALSGATICWHMKYQDKKKITFALFKRSWTLWSIHLSLRIKLFLQEGKSIHNPLCSYRKLKDTLQTNVFCRVMCVRRQWKALSHSSAMVARSDWLFSAQSQFQTCPIQ